MAELNGRPGPRRALDLAMGEGRHAIPLAEAGFVTYGVDVAVDRLQNARRMLHGRRLDVRQWAADLDTYPLPAEHFDLLFCTRFLLRARWDDLKRSVRPGGFVMYETFTTGQIARGFGPSATQGHPEPGRGAVLRHRTICFIPANSPAPSTAGPSFTPRRLKNRRPWRASSRGSREPDAWPIRSSTSAA